jgi:putative endonuclease
MHEQSNIVPYMERHPVIYILASQNRRALYIGVTTNLSRRLEEHRQGMVQHTARYNIKRLIYFESHETAPDAIAREKQLKNWRREKKLILINRSNPDWRDLGNEID